MKSRQGPRGVRRLAGSFLTFEDPNTPAQEPLIPLSQLTPTIGEIKVAEEALEPRLVGRNGKRQIAPRKYRKPQTARQRYGYSRVELARLLDKPGVAQKLANCACLQYRGLASRNVTMDELAAKHKISTIAMEAIVEGWESEIILATCEVYQRFRPCGTEGLNSRDFERMENESDAAQDADIAKTGGESIGGRIVSRGAKDSPGKTFQNMKLDTFERSGTLRGTESASPEHDFSGDDLSEEDDYGENSGDDIFRSE